MWQAQRPFYGNGRRKGASINAEWKWEGKNKVWAYAEPCADCSHSFSGKLGVGERSWLVVAFTKQLWRFRYQENRYVKQRRSIGYWKTANSRIDILLTMIIFDSKLNMPYPSLHQYNACRSWFSYSCQRTYALIIQLSAIQKPQLAQPDKIIFNNWKLPLKTRFCRKHMAV